jgi:hypothetical protein
MTCANCDEPTQDRLCAACTASQRCALCGDIFATTKALLAHVAVEDDRTYSLGAE